MTQLWWQTEKIWWKLNILDRFYVSLKTHAKIDIFQAVLQMLRRGQNGEFCHKKSRGKNNVTSLIKLQSTSFFLQMEPIYLVFIISLLALKKNSQDLTKCRLSFYLFFTVTIAFWLTL